MKPPVPTSNPADRPAGDRLHPDASFPRERHFQPVSGFWRQVFGNPRRGASFRYLLLAGLLAGTGLLSAAAQSKVDLSLSQTISNAAPQTGDAVTYTLTLRNAGAVVADSVAVTDKLPLGGLSYASATVTRGSGTWSYAGGVGTWNVGTLAAGDSAVLQIRANVTQPGVWFNAAFVARQKQPDEDSTPGNEVLTEDDYASACFSVPVMLYPDEEITVTLPEGLTNTVWTKDNQPITASTPDSEVVIHANGSLTIRTPGTYRFTTSLGNCPAGGCCPVVVVPGAYGSIGDLVWKDFNGDGQQNPGTDGIAGVTVRLLDSGGTVLKTALTDEKGRYRFDSLRTGEYVVEFVKPTGYDPVPRQTGGDGGKDSDADPATGRTGLIKLGTDAATRSTLDVDAGFKPACENPVVTANPTEQTICEGDSNAVKTFALTVKGSTEFITYQWYAALPSDQLVGAPIDGALHAHFRPTTAQLPPADGTTHHYAVFVRRFGLATCADTVWVAMKVNPKPATPTLAAVPLTCQGESASLVATSAGSAIRWYATATAPTATATTDSGQPFVVKPDSSASYFAEAVSASGCASPRVQVFVGVNPKPAKPSGLSALANACPDSTVNLNLALRQHVKHTLAGSTFEWHTGETPTSPVVTDSLASKSATLYLFEKSAEGCYGEPLAVSVSITPCGCQSALAVAITAPAAVCGTGPIAASVTSTANGKPLGGLWSSTGSGVFSTVNEFSTSYTPSKADSSAGTITLTFTTLDPDGDGPCQPVTRSAVVSVNGVPTAPTVRADTTLCAGATVALSGTSSAGAALHWYTAPTGGTLVGTSQSGGEVPVSPEKTTTYYAEATLGTCVSPQRTPLTVTVQPCATMDLSLVKDASNRSPAEGDTITYTLEVQNAGPATATGIEVRDVLPKGLLFIHSDNLTRSGDTLTGKLESLAAAGVHRFTFRAKVTGESTITNRAQIAKATGNDSDSTPGNGLANAEDDESFVEVTPRKPCAPAAPTLSASKTSIAPNECVVLTAKGCENGHVEWTGGKTGPTLTVCPAETTTYTATCTTNGCTSPASDPLTVTVTTFEAPTAKASTTTLCNGSATLTATGCATGTVLWSNGQSGASITVSPRATTTYFAVCKSGQRTSPNSNQVTVTVASATIPVVGATSADICPGASTTLTAYGCPGTVLWSNGQEGASITVSPKINTTYTAQCKVDQCVSEKSNELVINVLSGATPVVTASTTSLCAGGSVVLTATGCSGGVQWSNGLSGFTVTVNEPGSYSAKCVGAGCTSDFSKPLVIKSGSPAAAPTVVASKPAVCAGEKVTLTASGCANGTVTWNTGATGASLTVTLTEAQTFTATCTLDGCTSVASKETTVTLTQAAIPVVAASKTTPRKGESIVLTATGCTGTVTWNNGMTGPKITVSPKTDTTYTATCTVGSCVSGESDALAITVECGDLPNAPVLVASQSTVLKGGSVTLRAKGCFGGTVTWNTGATGDSLQLTLGTTTTFTATCTVEGCVSEVSEPRTVTVSDCLPVNAPIVVARTNATLCLGESTVLTATGCAGTVTWSLGGTGDTLRVTPTVTTTYTATCTVGTCVSPISNETTVVVVVPAVPVVSASQDTVKTGETVTLKAEGCNGTVIWSNGAIGGSLVVKITRDTTFTARCSVGRCTGEAAKPVTVRIQKCENAPAAPRVTVDKTTVCPGGVVTLKAEGCAGTVTWNNIHTSPTFSVGPFETTTYTATCTVGECTSPASEGVTVVVETPAAPVRSEAPLANACPTSTVSLTAAVQKPASGTVEFYTGVTIGSPKVENPDAVGAGTYYAFVKTETGCFGEPLALVTTVTPCDTTKKVVSLGIAKQVVGKPVELGPNQFALTYEFRLSNMGTEAFTKLRLRDDLKTAYGAKKAVVDSFSVTAEEGLAVNPAFTGEGDHTDLLLESSTLPVGTTRWVRLRLRVNLTNSIDSVFHNTAVGKAWTEAGDSAEDASTLGFDADPDNDTNPTNNSVPTNVTLRLQSAPLQAAIGLAMHADTIRQPDGTYRVIYTLTLKNYGDQPATRVQVTDSLDRVFTGGVSFTVVDKPSGLPDGSTLTTNPNFDGKTDVNLLVADRSSLAARQTETFRFTVLVVPDGRTEPFLNTALATARYGDFDEVLDYSTNGFNPAPDGVPALAFEPTPVTLPTTDNGQVFIPEGFSPNGDGVNDVFRIRNTAGATVNLQIFNRWGQLVFSSEEYKNDWDGTSNRGAAFNNRGLPDGTYYYVVSLSDGRRFARYLTLMR